MVRQSGKLLILCALNQVKVFRNDLQCSISISQYWAEVELINIKIKIALIKISLMICHTLEIILHNHYNHDW